MDFSFSKEQDLLRKVVREFVEAQRGWQGRRVGH